jgi:hypothetical protein
VPGGAWHCGRRARAPDEVSFGMSFTVFGPRRGRRGEGRKP